MDAINFKPRFLSYQKVPSEVWQVRLVRLPPWIFEEDMAEPCRLSIGVCACPRTSEIVMEDSLGVDDMTSLAARTLSAAARKWRRRPGMVQTSDPETAGYLRGLLTDGARVEVEDLPVLDEMVAGLLGALTEGDEPDPRPEALSVPGVTVEQMAAFARAAARFFAAAPWRQLSADDLIRIESPEAGPDLRYAAVMGSQGTELGLLFFDGPALWEAFAAGDADTILEKGFWSVSFDADWELVEGDLSLWERHGLSRAGELYPMAARRHGQEVERPDAVRLAFFEGMLEALAATTEEEMDAGRWEKAVATHRGELSFTLALPDLLAPESPEPGPEAVFPGRPGMGERWRRDLQKLLAQQSFQSLEETNEFLSELDGDIPHPEPATPMDEALDLVDQAWEARGRRRRLLARRALDLWPDCADAYVLLAEMEQDLEKERDLLARGVAAGERALGPRMFEEQAGDFWMIMETRPYMRARLGLAETLRDLGETEEAADHLREMLRLNPQDNQGVRYLLLSLLLEEERDDEAAAFLDRYGDEPSAWWTYSRAFLAFRREGDSPAARHLLRTAFETNRFVAKYLLDPALLPPAPPPFYRPGEDDEAMIYAADNEELWEDTPGALAWLSQRRAALGRSPGKKAKSRKTKKKKRR